MQMLRKSSLFKLRHSERSEESQSFEILRSSFPWKVSRMKLESSLLGRPFRPQNDNAGMTLMELLIASALVGIVMVGTVSVDHAVHSMRRSTADAAMTAMQTTAMMTEITNDVSKAVGDAQNLGIVDCTKDNTAIGYAFCSNFTNPTFCARQDGTDPNVYTDDNWICYWKPINNTDANIYKCIRPAGNGAGQGPGICTINDQIIGTVACANVACSSYLLTFSITSSPLVFNIDLTNRAYPTQQVDPNKLMKNPEYKLSSRVSPLGHSY